MISAIYVKNNRLTPWLFTNPHRRLYRVSFFVVVLSYILLALPAGGECGSGVRLRLDKLIKERIKIAIPGFTNRSGPVRSEGLDKIGKDILVNDLLLSGLFDTISPSRIFSLDPERVGEANYGRLARLGAQLLVLGDFERPKDRISIKLRLFDITDRDLLIGKHYEGKKKLYRWMIHRFADDVIGALIGTKGVNATQIAFSSFFRGNKEIYVIDFDGQNPLKITRNNSISVSPAWSPGGEKIAYTSYFRGNPDLFVIKRNGRKKKMVSNEQGLNDSPAWSPDGEHIAYVLSKGGNSDIYLLSKDGIKKRITFFRGIDTSPAWSPDGKKLVYTSNRSGTPQIYVMEASRGDRGRVKRVSYGSSHNDDPSWSPDGKSIAYTSLRRGHFEIVVEDLENNVNLQMTTTRKGSSEHPSWSPDGRFITFSSSKNGRPQIYIVRSDGGGLKRLTFLEGGGYSPCWSPRLFQ